MRRDLTTRLSSPTGRQDGDRGICYFTTGLPYMLSVQTSPPAECDSSSFSSRTAWRPDVSHHLHLKPVVSFSSSARAGCAEISGDGMALSNVIQCNRGHKDGQEKSQAVVSSTEMFVKETSQIYRRL